MKDLQEDMITERPHLALLGDSIFDNKSYVGANGKDVITHLREIIPSDWQATLGAFDGSVIANVSSQFEDAPVTTTHFVISVGGNDAILNADVLEMPSKSSAEVFNELANRCDVFEANYIAMLETILARNLPTAVCTIYYPKFPNSQIQRVSVAALASFNDIIIRQAVTNGLPILDLRLICNSDLDYANEIEPSDAGGNKIARKILELVKTHNFDLRRTEVFI